MCFICGNLDSSKQCWLMEVSIYDPVCCIHGTWKIVTSNLRVVNSKEYGLINGREGRQKEGRKEEGRDERKGKKYKIKTV